MILLCLSILAASLAAAAPQTASRTALVTVTDVRNRPIVDLAPDDVVISESGMGPVGANATREVLGVHLADYPVVILVDTGAAARDDYPLMRKAIARFIDRLGRRPIAIGTIGSPPALVTALDDPLERVLDRLDRLEADAPASQPLHATAVAARTLAASGSLFSAIVVVSAAGADPNDGRADDLVGPIVDSGAIVQVIANRPPPSAAAEPAAPDADNTGVLRDLARQTLGQFTAIYSAASYQAALDRLADRMSNEVMIEYVVPAGSKASDVKVGVRIAGARARGLGVRPR